VSQQNSGQMIPPPNALKLKVGGGRLGAIDPAAIAKAEAALKSLANNFSQWLADEITKLEAARQQVRALGVSIETMENLYLRAHDLKGLGTTYGYQLITRIVRLPADHPHRGLALPPDRRQGKARERAARPGRRAHRRHQGGRARRHQDRRPSGRPRAGGRA
jgi:hypothetical protein